MMKHAQNIQFLFNQSTRVDKFHLLKYVRCWSHSSRMLPLDRDHPSPVDRMADPSKNITLPQTSFAGSNKKPINKRWSLLTLYSLFNSKDMSASFKSQIKI